MSKKTSFSKSKIIKKVTLLFHSKGYLATSMQDIVDASNLNRSSIYNTFGSKLELYILCFETCETKYRRDIQKIILSAANPLKSLIDIFYLSLNQTNKNYFIPNYISEVKNSESAIQKIIDNQHIYFLDLFEDIIKRGQNLSSINNRKSSRQYAIYLLTTYYGLQVMKSFVNKDNNLENVIYNILYVLE